MNTIAEIQLKEISNRLLDGQNMTLDVSDVALSCISDKGYDVRYGARPLKRVLNSMVLNPLSQLVLEGSVLEGVSHPISIFRCRKSFINRYAALATYPGC